MTEDKKQQKPGPKPDRLVIEEDPGEALDKLIGKKAPQKEPEPEADRSR